MGRRRWTTRLTVEECYPLDIGQLVRAAVFDADPRSLCAFTWNDSAGTPISGVTFRVFPDRTGALAVHFYHPVPMTPCSPAWIQQQIVRLSTTKCHFGGVRRWFRCSLIRDGYPCKRRVRALYSTPREKLFGCRQCHNLTYRSAQQHDQRIDRLLKLPAAEFTQIFRNRHGSAETVGSSCFDRALAANAEERPEVSQSTPQFHRTVRSCENASYGNPRPARSSFRA